MPLAPPVPKESSCPLRVRCEATFTIRQPLYTVGTGEDATTVMRDVADYLVAKSVGGGNKVPPMLVEFALDQLLLTVGEGEPADWVREILVMKGVAFTEG